METDLGKRIGRRLKTLREQRGLTQAEFAKLTGKAIETISNIERGKTIPGLLTLELFANRLSVSLEEIVRSDIPINSQNSEHAGIIEAAAKRLNSAELELVAGVIDILDKQRRNAKRTKD